ncbi:MAG: sulfite oxidase heme-binding subunit YedZ [Xanthobacteraceae bacterium]
MIAFVGVLLPAFWIFGRFAAGTLGGRPVMEVIHFTGDWTVRILWITLAVTPFARIFKLGRLLLARRILGVASFAYIICHLTLYTLDQMFDFATVVSEILHRFYLTIGFIAILGLASLAATSTDAMLRRCGGQNWNRLHTLCYPVAVLAEIHFLLQTKNDIFQPTLMLGFLLWLFGYRIIQRYTRDVSLISLIVLAFVSSALTAVIETSWYYFRSGGGIDAERVFIANFDFSYNIRPTWYVLAATLAVPLAAWLWHLRPQGKSVPKTTSRAASGVTRVQSAS